MSVYLTYGQRNNERAKITNRYMNPFGGLKEMEPDGFHVERVPEPETPEGLDPVLMVKFPAEGSTAEPELYYDYVAIPEPEETQLAKLQQQLDTLTAKASALSSGQEIQEDVITEIVMHVYK
ncbi:hypothetical protein [Saccharibacillus brassicae]|uniref:Uncharacterized protein n=1 Tax=Saccharibacillus brassicae TaxID=2583377 RepID=A0A4Y6UX54_SACBS|nr:hypothetical protein [Saccharibacillus brassicae]QDH22312.1 hypothetical protein FFV09_16535 [Saccharibacillus brassicae]